MIAHACSKHWKTVFLRCEKLPEVRCTHRRDVSQNLLHIETEMQLEAVIEIAIKFSVLVYSKNKKQNTPK